MKPYAVTLEGTNFLLELEEKPEKIGFSVVCYVEATSEEAAESGAIEMLRHDPELDVLNETDDPPEIFLDSVEEIKQLPKQNRSEFDFYAEEE